jgi:nucleoside-diphosphate-sugar epimerase
MSIFVTGATGFVGRNFLEWLMREVPDVQFTCLVRDPAKAQRQWAHMPQFGNGRIQWLQGDLLEPGSYAKAAEQAEWVFHIAALVSLRNGPEFYQANTDATQTLVTSLKHSARLKRLVFVSSISAFDRPLDQPALGPLTEESIPHPNTDYGKSKLEAERRVQQSGLPYTILRPPYIYGPYPRVNSSMDRLIRNVRDQAHYTRFPFPGRASEIYVEDLAGMMWTASQHPATQNQAFFVSNPTPVRVGDVYPKVAQALGVPYRPMSPGEQQIERFKRLLYRQYPENVLLRVMFEDFFYCSPAKWYELTGFKPRYGYEEGLAKTVRWFQANGMI